MSTKRFLLPKIIQLFLTLFLVTAITFILMKLSPIDAAEAYARRVFTVDDSRIELIREEMGLNRPLILQYFDWLVDLLHFDLGTSLVDNKDVFYIVGMAAKETACIVLLSTVIQAAGALILGVLLYLTGIREKDGEQLNLLLTLESDYNAVSMPTAEVIKSQLGKVGIDVTIYGTEQMQWYADYLEGKFDLTLWHSQFAFASPHCWFTPMDSMVPQTPSLPGIDGSDEFLDTIKELERKEPALWHRLFFVLALYMLPIRYPPGMEHPL